MSTKKKQVEVEVAKPSIIEQLIKEVKPLNRGQRKQIKEALGGWSDEILQQKFMEAIEVVLDLAFPNDPRLDTLLLDDEAKLYLAVINATLHLPKEDEKN
jgi:hypothetical protein